MNKHRGRDVDEYLKERGIFEDVETLTQKELATLRADEPLKPGEAYRITEEPTGHITDFAAGSGIPSNNPIFYSRRVFTNSQFFLNLPFKLCYNS